jgi:prevent-host-death family protein
MSTVTISATTLKNDTANVINQVIYNDVVAIVSKYGKPLVKIEKITESAANARNIQEILDTFYGSAIDFPDVTKKRYFRDKDISFE